MDERVMLQWADDVLKPYVATAPPDIVPLLFLDSYKCHLMSSVVNKIQDLGIKVQHIPGGCTGLTQPVDMGINKPLKNTLQESEKYSRYLAVMRQSKEHQAILLHWMIQFIAYINGTC
jgi:DDE superfamily endonuclease